MHPILQKDYACEYLLQVWDEQGQKRYQRSLQSRICTWSVCNEYLIYKPKVGEDNFEYYHIVCLNKGNVTFLVKDCINEPQCKISSLSAKGDFIAFNQGVLYIANSKSLFLLDVSQHMKQQDKLKIELTKTEIQKLNPGAKIHALFNKITNQEAVQTIVGFETKDAQIDFCEISAQGISSNQFTYSFNQQGEIIPREIGVDMIAKMTYVIDMYGVFYAIALRMSGNFDIYWDMVLVDSTDNQNAVDVMTSTDQLYFRMASGEIKSIKANGSSSNFDESLVEDQSFDFSIIFYQNIKNHVNLYSSFLLMRTTLFVTHGYFISLFNIQENQWVQHAKFSDMCDVVSLFKSAKPSEFGQYKLKTSITVILRNGDIYEDIQIALLLEAKSNNKDSFKLQIQNQLSLIDKTASSQSLQTKKVLQIIRDSQNINLAFILSENQDSKRQLFALNSGKIVEIGSIKISQKTNIVVASCPSVDDSYLVVQNKKKVQVYQVQNNKSLFSLDDNTIQVENEPQDELELNLVFEDSIKGLSGKIHTSFSTTDKTSWFFVDQSNLYQYNIELKQSKVYLDQQSVTMRVIDNEYCYSLSHKSLSDKTSGLRLYNINTLVQKQTDLSFHLENAQVGYYSHFIDWNQENGRLSFIKSLDEIVIIPALHRNTIAFIGMNKREDYLATKVVNDKFYAFNKKNFIFCWSSITGKLLSMNRLPTRQDYTNFEIYRSQQPDEKTYDQSYLREWHQQILLVSKDSENMIDEKMYLSQEQQKPSVLNQVSYQKQQIQDFKEFRIVEILSETEVTEHLFFIHQVYKNQTQRLFFNDTLEYMLEILNEPRVFLYKRENITKRQVKWNCVKRFQKFPYELEDNTGLLKSLSPSFMYYLDIDKKLNQFIIRDTFTMNQRCLVPKYIMSLDDERIESIMSRFMWINNDSFKIVSTEGLEVLIDIKQHCSQTAFNVIPLFELQKKKIRHLYLDKEPLNLFQVKKRLIRKYQAYKSAYYLEAKTTSHNVYPQLFNVDYQLLECQGLYIADLSFTYLHWKMMEELSERQLDIMMIDDKQIELLCYNILPGGSSVLHRLCSYDQIIERIFQVAQPSEDNLKDIKIHIPFVKDFDGKSPMHLCKEKQDLRNIDVMLKYLQGYGIDHHSRAITDLYPYFLEKELPSLNSYFDSRLCQTEKLAAVNKGFINDDNQGIIEQNIWHDPEQVQTRLMSTYIKGNSVEKPITVELIDLPRLFHLDDPLSDKFFDQLAETDQYEIFEKKVIKKMIEFNYELVKKWTIIKLFVPFVIFQSTLFVYLNIIFGDQHYIARQLDFPCQILLGIFALYFLRNEYYQLKSEGFNYLKSVWNYIDVITPLIILFLLMMNSFMPTLLDDKQERQVQAVGVFFMWFKFLYFFRIFKNFGYLTRLIILVIFDMKHFLIVLFFTIVAFSDSFLTLSNGNLPDERFVTGFADSILYTYRMILGDFAIHEFGSVGEHLMLVLFVICTLFNMIVMLNLLIAIISETFAVVKENAENASYQEMASMIGENNYLIPDSIKRSYAKKNQYLMVLTEIENGDGEEKDLVLKEIQKIKKLVTSKHHDMQKLVKDLVSTQKKQERILDSIDYNQQKLMSSMDKRQSSTSLNYNRGGQKGESESIKNVRSSVIRHEQMKTTKQGTPIKTSQYLGTHQHQKSVDSSFSGQQ